MASLEGVPDVGGENVHIVLLGDSTLDNGRYLNLARGELSVERQLLKRCTDYGWEMTVLAQDGSMLEDVRQRQLLLIPPDATHVVMSASGNDLLSLLNQMVVANFTLSSMYGAIGSGLKQVAETYHAILKSLKDKGVHLACCTVYRPNFNHMLFKTLAVFSLGLHNSRIHESSVDLDCSVIDLASLFDCNEDFANPLELSTRGGSKVVENIVTFVHDHPISMLRRWKNANSHFTEEDSWAPAAHDGGFLIPMRCCATRAPHRKVYASKRVAKGLDQPDEAFVGGPLEPALEFSQAQQPWREM